MKAAVLYELGKSPVFQDFSDPMVQNDGQLLLNVKAAAVKNIDKLRASGNHYASYTQLPVVVGIDGVGVLENGKKVYAQGVTGMIADKALIANHRYTVLPDNLDFTTAAALPNAVLGATMALRFRAHMEKRHTVLINGATGVTGQLAVQVAKHYGASRIIVTGRNADVLEKLKGMGADTAISLHEDDEAIVKKIQAIHQETPIDIVIDYLWGHPVELIIQALQGGGANNFLGKSRIVTVGSMAGENINLTSGTLRSSAIEIVGSGLGSFSPEDFKKFNTEVLPEMFKLAAEGKLTIETVTEPLENIEKAWNKKIEAGKRLVMTIS